LQIYHKKRDRNGQEASCFLPIFDCTDPTFSCPKKFIGADPTDGPYRQPPLTDPTKEPYWQTPLKRDPTKLWIP